MIKLKIHQLESFLQVADSGSFRKAAELMHRSPSAVSAHVQQLEEQLQVSLLERTTRHMVLTPEGRLLLDRCQHILLALDAVAQEVHDQALFRRGRMSIGVSPSISRHHLLPVLSGYQKANPELVLEMHEGFAEQLYAQLTERRTDFAIGPGMERQTDFHARPIIKDPIVALLPMDFPLDAKGTISLKEIAEQTQVCMPRGTAIRQVIEKAFKANKLQLRARFEVMYPQGLFELVAAGMGVSMMPLLSLPPREQRNFKVAALSEKGMHREMCLITLKSRKQSPAARQLAERIVQALRETLGEQEAKPAAEAKGRQPIGGAHRAPGQR